MKAVLEFNLPEDNNEYILTTRARNFYISLYDISQKIRAFEKYDMGIDPPEEGQDFNEWAQKMSKMVQEIWSECNKATSDID
jgi:hypothetical protein